jgi:hypothetical protein
MNLSEILLSAGLANKLGLDPPSFVAPQSWNVANTTEAAARSTVVSREFVHLGYGCKSRCLTPSSVILPISLLSVMAVACQPIGT